MKMPGVIWAHQLITPTCRESRTAKGAWVTATAALEQVYDKHVRSESNANVTWHLVLVRDDVAKAA